MLRLDVARLAGLARSGASASQRTDGRATRASAQGARISSSRREATPRLQAAATTAEKY
jgi:hypothetical protein